MRLARWCPFFLVAVLLMGMPQAVDAQSGYTVTATLDPNLPESPDWGPLPPLNRTDGLVRGADGYLYLIRHNYDDEPGWSAISQVNPTTGAARLLYVLRHWGAYGSFFFRGREGRLYFTFRDGGYIEYEAPGYSAYANCFFGCVLYIDTANSADLRTLYTFGEGDHTGWYLGYGVEFEDTEGRVYVYSDQGNQCDNGDWIDEALVQITFDGHATAYHDPRDCPDELPFDWGSVSSSGNNTWPWSDELEYFTSGQNVYQRDPVTDTTVPLVQIAASDGDPTERGGETGLTEASGYLYGATSSGGALNGGVIFRIRVPSLASPDLIITEVSNPPTTAAPGVLFTVSDTTRNNGAEPAAISRNAYYLSRDGTHLDIRLLNGRYLPELWPGQESSDDRSVRIPAATPTGLYWLMACADNDSQVAESNDANNCRVADSRVTVGFPDLRQTSVSITAAFASPGGKITVNDTVDNPTIVTAAASMTRYYLSVDAVKNAGDTLLTGKRAIPELSPGEENGGTALLTLPLTVPDGAYYVLACADDLAKIKEVNETNNCRASSTTILVGWADLVTTTISDPPLSAPRGGKFTVSDTVRNQGTIPAAATVTRYYLSGDGAKDAGDVLLTGTRSVGSLTAGASSPGSRLVTVPLSAPHGSYRVLACADDTTKVPEQNHSNNCRATTGTVTVH